MLVEISWTYRGHQTESVNDFFSSLSPNISRNLQVAGLQKILFSSPINKNSAGLICYMLVKYTWRYQACKMGQNEFLLKLKGKEVTSLQ